MCTYSISVDDNVLERVKPALPNNEAVEAWMQSQMDILLLQLAESLTRKPKEKVSLSSRLRGIAHAPKDFDYKQELASRFEITRNIKDFQKSQLGVIDSLEFIK